MLALITQRSDSYVITLIYTLTDLVRDFDAANIIISSTYAKKILKKKNELETDSIEQRARSKKTIPSAHSEETGNEK